MRTQTPEDTTTIEPVKETIEEKIISQNENINDNTETKDETEIISKETQTKNNSENILENEEHDNLSVEDIELGKLFHLFRVG